MVRRTCKWYQLCPVKKFYEHGQLERAWLEEYCWGRYEHCVRYRLEAKGELHPDNLLPDGNVRKDLK